MFRMFGIGLGFATIGLLNNSRQGSTGQQQAGCHKPHIDYVIPPNSRDDDSQDTPNSLQVVIDIFHTDPLPREMSFSDLVEKIKNVELEIKDHKTSKTKKVSHALQSVMSLYIIYVCHAHTLTWENWHLIQTYLPQLAPSGNCSFNCSPTGTMQPSLLAPSYLIGLLNYKLHFLLS